MSIRNARTCMFDWTSGFWKINTRKNDKVNIYCHIDYPNGLSNLKIGPSSSHDVVAFELDDAFQDDYKNEKQNREKVSCDVIIMLKTKSVIIDDTNHLKVSIVPFRVQEIKSILSKIHNF